MVKHHHAYPWYLSDHTLEPDEFPSEAMRKPYPNWFSQHNLTTHITHAHTLIQESLMQLTPQKLSKRRSEAFALIDGHAMPTRTKSKRRHIQPQALSEYLELARMLEEEEP